jgi:GNAT superfamily N-acetyltransferase
MKTRELKPDMWPDIEKLFGPNGACAGCWCMFWRYRKDEPWPKMKGAPSKRRFKALVQSGRAHGVLAYERDEPIGWCSFEQRSDMDRINRSPSLVCDDADRVWSLPCFFVKPGWRGKGVASKLLDAAVKALRKRGAKIIEGYPYKTRGKTAPVFVWTGTLSMFTRAGFKVVGPKPKGKQRVRITV